MYSDLGICPGHQTNLRRNSLTLYEKQPSLFFVFAYKTAESFPDCHNPDEIAGTGLPLSLAPCFNHAQFNVGG